MKRRSFVSLVLAVPAAAVARRAEAITGLGAARSPVFVERWSWAMGQAVRIQLYAGSESQGYEAAAAALAELRRVEAKLSRFDEASDLSELNRQAGRRFVGVAPELLDVLRLAEHVRRQSGGAFDPAVEPLLVAWGFRAPRVAPPTERELAEARRAVAAARIELAGGRARLATREARLDLGGIGVGYGLDRAAAVLRAHGIRAALLDVSGDMLAIGSPPGQPAWPVAIAGTTRVVPLRDAALATSANTVQTVSYGSVTVGHVMDPATGRGADRERQVTVVAPSAVLADACATAALVSGRDVAARSGLTVFAAEVAAT